MFTDSLDFEDHLRTYVRLHGDSDFARRQAEEMHAQVVFNPLRDAAHESLTYADKLSDQAAQHQLRHGAARRLLMTWHAYRVLIFGVPADRTDPVPREGIDIFQRDLNIIYFNLVGVMDNYAWALLKQFGNGAALPPTQVGLFTKAMEAQKGLDGLDKVVAPFSDWNRALRSKRDPVAHRIPLTIPPAHLNPVEADQYRALGDRYWEAVKALDFEGAGAISRAQDGVGSFKPIFLHDPSEPAIPLYPTLPTDCAELLKLMKALHTYIDHRL